MNIMLSILYYIQMLARKINWLLYKDKITTDGRFLMGLGGGISGAIRKDQIILGKNVGISGWLTVFPTGKITIGDYSCIGRGSVLQAMNTIEIGSYTLVAPDVWIVDNNNHSIYAKYRYIDIMGSRDFNEVGVDNTRTISKPIKIGSHVWIGRRSMILKGVTVGDRAVVAAYSIVTHDVPADSIVAGNPAKIVKQIDQEPINPDEVVYPDEILKEFKRNDTSDFDHIMKRFEKKSKN